MIKKTITYIDYDDNERTEEFHFNLSKSEVFEMDFGTTGGLVQMLEKIISEKDNKKIIETFKDIILKSYGVKSPDGKYFVKSEEATTAFTQTEAYSMLFMELASSAELATAFVNGIVPPHTQV